MKAIYLLVYELLNIYKYIVIVNVIISWLVAFSVLNTQNRFVYSILELSYKLTEPMLNKIRRFLPNLGTLDICLLYTSPSPRDGLLSRMPSSA